MSWAPASQPHSCISLPACSLFALEPSSPLFFPMLALYLILLVLSTTEFVAGGDLRYCTHWDYLHPKYEPMRWREAQIVYVISSFNCLFMCRCAAGQ
jgi:hypothetical protein